MFIFSVNINEFMSFLCFRSLFEKGYLIISEQLFGNSYAVLKACQLRTSIQSF